MALLTPLGEVYLFLDGKSISYDVCEMALEKGSHLSGKFLLIADLEPDGQAHRIACILSVNQNVACFPEEQETYSCISYYSEDGKIKISIGMKEEKLSDFSGDGVQNSVFKPEENSPFGKFGEVFCHTYEIPPEAESREYVFGIAWLTGCAPENDWETCSGADPYTEGRPLRTFRTYDHTPPVRVRNSSEYGNAAFHLMQDFDGTVILPLRWEDDASIRRLLAVSDDADPILESFIQPGDPRNFVMLRDPHCAEPYPLVLIFKYIERGNEWILVDVDENDFDLAEYVRREYMQAGENSRRVSLKLNSELTASDLALLTNIGYACEKGTLFEQDLEMAVRMYEMASAAGDPLAANNLAHLYQTGLGVDKDVPLAVQLYEAAAAKGCSLAMVNLGNIYEYGELGEPDYKKCFFWYRAAAEAGNVKGIFNYANCYHWGYGVRKNYKKAFPIFKKLADSGDDLSACFYVGLYYQEGRGGLKKNYHQALRYYHKGAKAGDSYCYNQLGTMYGEGQGVKKNVRTAVKYYRKAAELGDSLAYANLGWFYEHGELGAPDCETALHYYKLSADMDDEVGKSEYERLSEEMDRRENASAD